MSELARKIEKMATDARAAARELLSFTPAEKDAILEAMAQALRANADQIIAANQRDLDAGRDAGLSSALLDRLSLDAARVDEMAAGLEQITKLPDPVGETIESFVRPNGLEISRIRVPIGVIGIVYESRPNVTADAGALCLKAGNAVILRGGKEARHSNAAIADVLERAGLAAGMPPGALQLVRTTERDAVRALVQASGLVDLIIPRGGEGLIDAVTRMAHVPVIKHYKGVCHTYVDAGADLEMALAICENAKVQRPGVCNAMETLLVHEAVAEDFLPSVAARLSERGVELRGDARCRQIWPAFNEASEKDWKEEYLDLILAVRVVADIDAAIDHIARYGSHHSDAIISADETAQRRFVDRVDSAATYVNASTRFTDGGQFGMGAEIGISTDKLHARGPMGLRELNTYKFVVRGEGQIR